MAYKYNWTEYPVAGVAKVLATYGGAHIANITLTSDAFNGAVIGRGDWLSFDNYSETTPTSISAVVREQAANGNWYVEILSAENAWFVYNPPVVEAEWNRGASSEKHFYLKKGDVARAHNLKPYDIVEVSADGFSGTPVAGGVINSVSGKKMVVTAAQGATGATGATGA